MAVTNAPSPTLTALMSAALALPGLSESSTEPVSAITADYRYSRFSENDLPADRLQTGSASRFTVESHQFDVQIPLPSFANADDVELELSAQHETMSGASPWFVMPDKDNNPVQVMSGATISDKRDDLLATVHLYQNRGRMGISAGLSEENDYRSVNVAFDREFQSADGVNALEAGVGYSYNTLEPEGLRSIPGQIIDADSNSSSVFVGFGRVLTPQAAIQASLGLTLDSGYLSDPYKLVFVNGTLRPDNRPEKRIKSTFLLRYRHHIRPVKASIHADYRYYQDDWGIKAHTFKLGWYQPLGMGWRLAPLVRYYSQTQADFYFPFLMGGSDREEFSSDYRLSPFGALSWAVSVDKSWGGINAGISFESYQSRAALSLNDVVVENPGLVDFNVLSAAIGYSF